MTGGTMLAVLGSPIAHSLSPRLHEAAYRVLGLPWTYGAIEMTGDGLARFLSSVDGGWRGLSLTMPLKRDVLPLLDRADELVRITGSANTVLFGANERRGFNTDVFGIVDAVGGLRPAKVHIFGAGATAASSVVAAARLGAESVHVFARSPERAVGLASVGVAVGVRVDIAAFGETAPPDPDLVISTLPGGASSGLEFSDTTVAHATLLEVAYDPWPGPMATRWMSGGGHVVPGIEMLVSQAVAQVRVFVGGRPDDALDDESAVIVAMRDAVGLSSHPAV